MTIAILALVMGAIAGFTVLGYRAHSYTFQQATAVNEARKGVETMVKEIREARVGDDGAYIIEKAEDYELIFYSDIDKDEAVERVRYFIKPAGGGSGSRTDQCYSQVSGGQCSVSFSDFLTGDLESAQVKVSVEGDLNSSNETVDIYADGVKLGTLCTGSSCGQCVGSWQDLTTFDVTNQASDNSIQFTADGSSKVGAFCDWQEENHSIKAKFEFSWTEAAEAETKAIFKKGVIDPTGWPIGYPSENEEIIIISENIQNEVRGKPVFSYFDGDQNPVTAADRLEKTTLMHLELIINVNPNRPPDDFLLQSDVQIRNLKTNL